MADPRIRIKRSSVSGKIPSANDVPLGELALNTYDGKLYASKNVGIGTTVFAVNPWSVGVGSDTYNTFFTTGNVGIGSTIPTSSLHVVGNTLVTGIITATSFVGDGSGLTGIVGSGSGIEVKEEGVGIGTIFTAVNFVGTGVTATANGNTAVITITQPVSGIGIGVRYNDINIGTGITSLNFSGTGISSVTSNNISGISTITVDLQSNLDGGTPTTNYGGIDPIEGGGI